MFGPYEETADGFEKQWGVNYLSHFLLTILLLPLLKAGGLPEQSSRIVNVSSCAHLVARMNFSDVNRKYCIIVFCTSFIIVISISEIKNTLFSNRNRFITEFAYAQSKLAQVIFTKKLQNLLREKKCNVQVYSVHPGVIVTELFTQSFLWKFRAILQFVSKVSTFENN